MTTEKEKTTTTTTTTNPLVGPYSRSIDVREITYLLTNITVNILCFGTRRGLSTVLDRRRRLALSRYNGALASRNAS